MPSPRPVCVACETEMRPEQNDILVVDYRIVGNDTTLFTTQVPCQCWSADLWKCPICSRKIVKGFGSKPLAYTEEDIDNWIAHYKKQDSAVIKNYEFRR